MAIMKCKMCGGDLNVTEGLTVVECEYCGSRQTIPSQDNEKKLTLFARADRLRRACEFDKAAGVYESIVAEFPEEAEAYWGLVLCRYGIEYVDDPATGKKVPTCHRSSFDSILEDADFEQSCENADPIARRQYREEAKAIEDIRRGILEVSSKEEPYDIFICYKETDENGGRTVDSVIAQDVYDALTEKGYRVFFSRISLEDKLGTEYEPYIFAALNSSKVMLVFGTDFEYFNAVWVKNEWSRFLALMTRDKGRHLIPCYKGVDAYDMPPAFAKLQAQDMGKVGAIQDLLRGIDKLLGRGTGQAPGAAAPAAPGVESLLERGRMFLEDQDWKSADEYFDRVLDIDPKCADAYVGKLCAELKCRSEEALADRTQPFEKSPNYEKAIRFAKQARADQLRAIHQRIIEQNEEARRAKLYDEAAAAQDAARTEKDFRNAAELYRRMSGYRDADERAEACGRLAEAVVKERLEKRKRLEARRKELTPVPGLIAVGSGFFMGLKADGTVMAEGWDSEKSLCKKVQRWRDIVAVAAGSRSHAIGLRADGTVAAAGLSMYGVSDVQGWRDIIAVAAGASHTVGLKADGTVVAAGENQNGQCDVQSWRDITAVSASYLNTVGLKADGTVVAAGKNDEGQCNVQNWRDIVAVVSFCWRTVGLRADGTVVATGENNHGQCNVSAWRDIVAVAAGFDHTVGLRVDGTVVAVGNNEKGQCNVQGWRDIVAVAADKGYTVGLRADGTVVTVGDNSLAQNDVENWRDIISVTVNDIWTMGLRADGSVAISDIELKYNVQKWKLFRNIDTRLQERKSSLESEQSALRSELENCKGLFAGKRRKEIEARLAELEAALKKL